MKRIIGRHVRPRPARLMSGLTVSGIALAAIGASLPTTGHHPPARSRPAAVAHHHHTAPAKPAHVKLAVHKGKPRKARNYRLIDSAAPLSSPGWTRSHTAAVYVNGSYWAPWHVAKQFKRHLWIDVIGSNPRAQVLDIEPGDASPGQAAGWVRAHYRIYGDHGRARLYTFKAGWPAVRASVAKLPPHIRKTVRYWIADPTGHEHILPGSDATQWLWTATYDLSTAQPGF